MNRKDKKNKNSKSEIENKLKDVNGGDNYIINYASNYDIHIDSKTGDFTEKPKKRSI